MQLSVYLLPSDLIFRQSLQSQMLRQQLTTLATRLSIASEMIDPTQHEREREKHRRVVFDRSQAKLEKEHKQLLNRKNIIEARKVCRRERFLHRMHPASRW